MGDGRGGGGEREKKKKKRRRMIRIILMITLLIVPYPAKSLRVHGAVFLVIRCGRVNVMPEYSFCSVLDSIKKETGRGERERQTDRQTETDRQYTERETDRQTEEGDDHDDATERRCIFLSLCFNVTLNVIQSLKCRASSCCRSCCCLEQHKQVSTRKPTTTISFLFQ